LTHLAAARFRSQGLVLGLEVLQRDLGAPGLGAVDDAPALRGGDAELLLQTQRLAPALDDKNRTSHQ
jgi:hypothetical protein